MFNSNIIKNKTKKFTVFVLLKSSHYKISFGKMFLYCLLYVDSVQC